MTAEEVASRVLDITSRGGDPEAVQADLENYFELSARRHQNRICRGRQGCGIGSHCKPLRSIIKELERQDKDPNSPYITSELVAFISEVTDDPAFHEDEEKAENVLIKGSSSNQRMV